MANAYPDSPNVDPSHSLPIIMIGGGGHARVLLDLLERLGRDVMFITDRDDRAHGLKIGNIVVRGADELIFAYSPAQVLLVNAVGSIAQPFARREVYQRFHSRGYAFATLIHPSATVSQNARLGAGVQVMAGAVVQAGVRIAENTLLNTRASVDHDCVIGPHAHIGPGVTISGDVQVGDTTHLGTGATIIQGIRIGREAMVGAAAAVVRNVPDGQRVVGVPAKPILAKSARPPAKAHEEVELFTVLLSAAGRRVALSRLLRRSVEEVGLRPRLLATDVNRASAAFHDGDVGRIVPRYSDPGCLDSILNLCAEMSVGLIVPTIDPDLPFYSEHRARFEAAGTRVMVSAAETIRICNDKRNTHDWLVSQRFPTVDQVDAHVLLANGPGGDGLTYPVFVKPRGGSSSVGARIVLNAEDLRFAISDGTTAGDAFIAQRVARGHEYTVDVYVDLNGRCRCAVPRLRIETRGGEVNKGMTVRCPAVQDVARRVAEALPGAWGVLNVQIFYDAATGDLTVSEINPRFGGGYPLTHQAGAPLARWVVEEVTGRPLTANDDDWVDGLMMLRYDDAVFVTAGQAGLSSYLPDGEVNASEASPLPGHNGGGTMSSQ